MNSIYCSIGSCLRNVVQEWATDRILINGLETGYGYGDLAVIGNQYYWMAFTKKESPPRI